MGGRGASSGISDNGIPYGQEFTSLYKERNIRFVRYNGSSSVKSPLETMTRGRVYVAVNANDELAYITYYDDKNKRFKTIDITGRPHVERKGKNIQKVYIGDHVHLGYNHAENGTRYPNSRERAMVDLVREIWKNKNR